MDKLIYFSIGVCTTLFVIGLGNYLYYKYTDKGSRLIREGEALKNKQLEIANELNRIQQDLNQALNG